MVSTNFLFAVRILSIRGQKCFYSRVETFFSLPNKDNLLFRFLQTNLPANEKGEELGIKSRAVSYHLRTRCAKGYIERIRQGVYRKVVKRVNRKNRPAA